MIIMIINLKEISLIKIIKLILTNIVIMITETVKIISENVITTTIKTGKVIKRVKIICASTTIMIIKTESLTTTIKIININAIGMIKTDAIMIKNADFKINIVKPKFNNITQ